MRRFIALLCILASFGLHAQELFCPSGDHYTKNKRKEFDTARMFVHYQLKFREDSTRLDDYTKAHTVLMVGEKYIAYCDYNRLPFDSINDYLAESRKQTKDTKATNQWLDYLNRYRYRVYTMGNLQNGQTTVQFNDILYKYEYTYPTPKIEWTLQSGDSIIREVPCKRATCHHAGRSYTAWYAESIPLPYGPFVFGGLPGLIMALHDNTYNWVFENSGVEEATHHRSMYLYRDKKIIRTTRAKALAAWKNDVEDFANLDIERFKVRRLVNGKWVKPEANNPRRPSNLLELEWDE